MVFVLSAPTAAVARAWGDRLSRLRFPLHRIQEFSWSLVVPIAESTTPGLADVPIVICDHEASDAEIRW